MKKVILLMIVGIVCQLCADTENSQPDMTDNAEKTTQTSTPAEPIEQPLNDIWKKMQDHPQHVHRAVAVYTLGRIATGRLKKIDAAVWCVAAYISSPEGTKAAFSDFIDVARPAMVFVKDRALEGVYWIWDELKKEDAKRRNPSEVVDEVLKKFGGN